jgi:hypothetical protein
MPQSDDERIAAQNAFRDALSGRTTGLIIAFREIEFLSSRDVGALASMLHRAEVKMGGLGSGPFVRIVTDDDRVRSVFTVTDAPFRVFATEEEALASLHERSSGCLGVGLFILAVVLLSMALPN